jgi:hypothetical protein
VRSALAVTAEKALPTALTEILAEVKSVERGEIDVLSVELTPADVVEELVRVADAEADSVADTVTDPVGEEDEVPPTLGTCVPGAEGEGVDDDEVLGSTVLEDAAELVVDRVINGVVEADNEQQLLGE